MSQPKNKAVEIPPAIYTNHFLRFLGYYAKNFKATNGYGKYWLKEWERMEEKGMFKPEKLRELYIKILDLYKEFLTLNRGFVDTKTTLDIKLPQNLSVPANEDAQKIHSKIQEVIKSGKLLDLTEVFELIYKG